MYIHTYIYILYIYIYIYAPEWWKNENQVISFYIYITHIRYNKHIYNIYKFIQGKQSIFSFYIYKILFFRNSLKLNETLTGVLKRSVFQAQN